MNRKHFLSTLIPAAAVLSSAKAWATTPSTDKAGKRSLIPPYLKPGDLIGITSPAGYIKMEEVIPSVDLMKSWGFGVEIGKTIGTRDFTFGGTDAERALDFQQMLDNPAVKAIMCARGGYGFVRIIDQIDFSKFRKHPKWIIGFSDITVLHCHLSRNYGVASIHSKMCNSFPTDWLAADPMQIETILSIKDALTGETTQYNAPFVPSNRAGRAEAELIGGNLRTIENMAGSVSELEADGKILFIEDTGEALYSIDRMFWNLKRSGKLSRLKGLVIGGFKLKSDAEGDAFGKNIYEIVMEKVKEYDYPVCFDFPVGHQKNNYALRCGVKHLMSVEADGSFLRSI
jgi:muramoyltetrapeptide carboxypeptidase